MFAYLSKKISIPHSTHLNCIAWNQKEGYISVGGDNGLLKVIKTDSTTAKPNENSSKIQVTTSTSSLSMNQSLEGHSGHVQVVTWNEEHQKLTSSDQNGVIIVWMLYKGTWYEEMINNRNKSIVKGMTWSSNGQKICIVYEDGAVIVGSVEGNRIWGKELKNVSLTAVQWSPDAKFLLFGSKNGDLLVYDDQGTSISKFNNVCDIQDHHIVSIDWYNGKNGYIAIDCPTLVICFQFGKIFLLKDINDEIYKTVNTNMMITCCLWNSFGSILAIAGKILIEGNKDCNSICFYSTFGEHLRTLKIPGKDVSCCSWEAGSLRLALSVDSNIYFANIRPNYRWTYFDNTVVFTDEKVTRDGTCITFWNTVTNTRYLNYVECLVGIAAYRDHCVLAVKNYQKCEENFILYVCNAISTPIDTKFMNFEPLFIAMNNSTVIVSSKINFLVWNFRVPRNSVFKCGRLHNDKIYHVDETPTGITEVIQEMDKENSFRSFVNQTDTADPICSIGMSEKILLIARESGIIQQYSLPHLVLTMRHVTSHKVCRLALNSDSTRAAMLDSQGALRLIRLTSINENNYGEITKFERKDCWEMCWAEDNPDLLAVIEKNRMYIFRGLEPEEPLNCSGYICYFKDLEIRCVLLDKLINSTEQTNDQLLLDLEIKCLRDTKELLIQVGLSEAAEFIHDNPHPRLWRLLGEQALRRLELDLAESAMVRYSDYLGIRFIKRLRSIPDVNLRRAEVLGFLGAYDEAEQAYLDLDRCDLAIALRNKLTDYARVLQLTRLYGSDTHLERIYAQWGEKLAAYQDWRGARQHLERGRALERLVDCHYRLEDFDQLATLAAQLPEQTSGLRHAARLLASVGMSQQAASCFVRATDVRQAVEICVRYNRWEQALELARAWRLPAVSELLGKYACHLLESGSRLQAIELYCKAERPLEAARLLIELAVEQEFQKASLLRLKKLYVLAALLVQGERGEGARIAAKAWRGAEAYHFMLLTHRQLFNAQPEAALRTALRLREYEDFLEHERLYAVLALASCYCRALATCSRAFIRLESLEPKYEELAIEIFSKRSPIDIMQPERSECLRCESLVPDCCLACPNCTTEFPACIVTGKPLMDLTNAWICKVCKHRASSEREVLDLNGCPLCHSVITYT